MSSREQIDTLIRTASLMIPLAVLTHAAAHKLGYFQRPFTKAQICVRLPILLIAFALYAFLPIALFKGAFHTPTLYDALPGSVPFGRELVISVLCYASVPLLLLPMTLLPSLRALWRDPETAQRSPLSKDLLFGVATWIISFPIVSLLSSLIELALSHFKAYIPKEQVSVTLLKRALATESLYISIAFILLVILLAPLVEEILFRGLLQNWLKRRVSLRLSIFFTSLLFAFFHFAQSQGLSNISLIVALFVLSLYLGFIYERQRSLYASIGFHALFNAVSTLGILSTI